MTSEHGASAGDRDQAVVDPARAREKGSILLAVAAVMLGWLLLWVPAWVFMLLAFLGSTDCGPQCAGQTATIVPVLSMIATLALLLAPVFVGWSVRRPWSQAWKVGVGVAVPALAGFVFLVAGGV
ncbi:hypothetical protein GCG21_03045 [Pseudactinotalea sp. HY160]|uniref:hypothetical protein n=1 Tax=Pseudactinotalea sp. HY160 TaxID=2654490 RepID=UPI00128E609D|nr:hypothetical protein [Pseudactinotalea sp. HY160]MPV48999.1 hypothetical protein [Pseudactinotalea sp. HY160]